MERKTIIHYPVIWILGLSLLIGFVANTIRAYHFGDSPPMWDNLAYQIQGLEMARAFLESQWDVFSDTFGKNVPVAYSASLGLSFIIFGFHPFSPYIISAVFGAGCLVVCYFLAVQIGSRRDIALAGTLLIAIQPNFIYQNFLQTRNDFPAAFFIALAWLILLKALSQQNFLKAFFAGVIGGLGVLFKLSAPGYMIWGFAIMLIIPVNTSTPGFFIRLKHVLFFAIGAVLTCGWFYIPALPKTLEYYQVWSRMTQWQSVQYGLHSPPDRILFYVRNLVNVHLGSQFTLMLSGIFFICLLYRLLSRQRREWFRQLLSWLRKSQFIITCLYALLAVGFLTLKGSLASPGDIPVLILLYASGIALLSQFFPVFSHSVLSWIGIGASIMVFLFYSISRMHIEKPKASGDFKYFAEQIKEFRNTYGLESVQFLNIFSHPVYNVDSVLWYWHMNGYYSPKQLRESRIENRHLLFSPEIAETISEKLSKIPFLIISERNAVEIGGEPFTTFNRMHKKINQSLMNKQQFIAMGNIFLEDSMFPLHFYLNKKFTLFNPANFTADGWVEWGSRFSFFALKPVKLHWEGIPIREIKKFSLVSDDNAQEIIFNLTRISNDGFYIYESNTVMPPGKKTEYRLWAEKKMIISASPQDSRKLAFRNVNAQAAFTD